MNRRNFIKNGIAGLGAALVGVIGLEPQEEQFVFEHDFSFDLEAGNEISIKPYKSLEHWSKEQWQKSKGSLTYSYSTHTNNMIIDVGTGNISYDPRI